MTVTMTARLPEGLKAEAEAYARSVGVSLNGLLGVALRDYLDQRRGMRPSAAPSPAPAAAASIVRPVESFKPPRSRSDPCPCGARDYMDRPIKFKHCHGKP